MTFSYLGTYRKMPRKNFETNPLRERVITTATSRGRNLQQIQFLLFLQEERVLPTSRAFLIQSFTIELHSNLIPTAKNPESDKQLMMFSVPCRQFQTISSHIRFARAESVKYSPRFRLTRAGFFPTFGETRVEKNGDRLRYNFYTKTPHQNNMIYK